MNLEDWRVVFLSFCFIIMIAIGLNFLWMYPPKRGESFLALALLGEGEMAEQYYPDDDPGIEMGDELHWTVYIYNHMAEAKYIALRVKLLNSTISPPNSTSCTPAPVPVIYEVRQVIMNNETWLHPINWSLNEVRREGNATIIESLMVNENKIIANLQDSSGGSFRMILELWVYDESSEDFLFGWKASEESRCAWNQMWFQAEIY